MTAILSLFDAIRAGDAWARVALAGAALAAFLAFASWQLWRIYDAGGDARDAKREQAFGEVRDGADAAGLKAGNCDPPKWNRSTQTCAP